MPPSVEQVAIVAGWLASFVFAALGVPWLVGKRQQKMLATKDHPLRMAYAGVVREDILPLMLADTRAAITDAVKAVKFPEPDLSKLAIQLDGSALEATLDSWWNKKKMEGVRAGRALPGQSSQTDLAIAQNASTNPEGADMLAKAILRLDQLEKFQLIKPATAKDWKRQLKDQFADTGDITDLLKGFGIDPAQIVGGASPGASGKGGPI